MKRTSKIASIVLVVLMVMSCFVFSSFASGDQETNTDEVVHFSHGGLLVSSPEFYEVESSDTNTNSINGRDGITLPSSVDFLNVNSPYYQYLPDIGHQYNTGSCVAFATTYYQFTFEANKYKGITTTPQNTYCPQFVYSIIQCGVDFGSNFESAYSVLERLGSLKYSDYNNNACYANNWYDYVHYNSDNTSAKINALKLRAEMSKINVQATNGQVIDLSVNSNNLDALDSIKYELYSGKILTTELRYSDSSALYDSLNEPGAPSLANIPENFVMAENRNAYAMVYSLSIPNFATASRHAMAIIGYDDSFWVDLNGNDEQDPGEVGAFKLIDSYGTGSDALYHDNGCIWVLYDALNTVSCCTDSNHTSPYRIPAFQIYNSVVPFYKIEVSNKDVRLIGKVNITSRTPRALLLKDSMIIPGEQMYGWNVYPALRDYNESTQSYVYTNVENTPIYNIMYSASPIYPVTFDLIFDLSDCFELFVNDSLLYYAQLKFYSPLGTVTINSASVIDDFQNCISTFNNCPMLLGNTETISYTIHTLLKGDLNYDGLIDTNDLNILKGYLASNVSLSNTQMFLADLYEDGIINVRDLKILKLIINGEYDDSLSDDENLALFEELYS